MFQLITQALTPNILLVEFLKGQYLDHYYFCYILMIYQIFLIGLNSFYLQMIQIFILKQTNLIKYKIVGKSLLQKLFPFAFSVKYVYLTFSYVELNEESEK